MVNILLQLYIYYFLYRYGIQHFLAFCKYYNLIILGNENDASDFTDLPEKNGHKILAPSESGICSCGAEWDKRSIQDEWLYVDVCSVACFYSIHDVKGKF